MGKIRVAIVGVGNCASALVQGVDLYRNAQPGEVIGLIHWNLGGYEPGDIEFVLAYDVDKRKVGQKISDAIFALPNNTRFFRAPVSKIEERVKMGILSDGIAKHMKDYPKENAFVTAKLKQPTPREIIQDLKKLGVDVMLNYLPVGSEKATRIYAECALQAKIAFINCIPVFIASDKAWAKRFKKKRIPIIGDDIKSQIGATIIHRMLAKLFENRGVKLDRTYQLNVGGNTDFLNMLERNRLKSKKISKTESVQSQFRIPLSSENIHIGPSDYIPWLNDNKICFLRMEGRIFGNVQMDLEMRLSVEDSPNSAGVVIDAIRCCKIARDREIGGALISPSAYFMKHPPRQFSDDEAKDMVEEFIKGKRND